MSCLDFLVSAYFHNENIVKGESLKQTESAHKIRKLPQVIFCVTLKALGISWNRAFDLSQNTALPPKHK